jgi:hypothetical protein
MRIRLLDRASSKAFEPRCRTFRVSLKDIRLTKSATSRNIRATWIATSTYYDDQKLVRPEQSPGTYKMRHRTTRYMSARTFCKDSESPAWNAWDGPMKGRHLPGLNTAKLL